ncbi:hypothetical protein JCM8547_003115 [Rhodosporidiobolus lusitaniae]
MPSLSAQHVKDFLVGPNPLANLRSLTLEVFAIKHWWSGAPINLRNHFTGHYMDEILPLADERHVKVEGFASDYRRSEMRVEERRKQVNKSSNG